MTKKKTKTKKEKTYVVGVDLGGTKILAAVVDHKGAILSEVKCPTLPDSGAKSVVKRMAGAVQQAIQEAGVPAKKVLAVGVGAPAPVDPRTGFVFLPPNLPALNNYPLGKRLGKALGLPVFVDNDVNVGTVGEHALGAGRGTKDMVGIFVGTGVGGGLIVNGRLRHGLRNSAGEVGHMIVGFQAQPRREPSSRAQAEGLSRTRGEALCGCGSPGCLEAYSSRTAIERDVRAAIAAGRETIMAELLEKSNRGRITSGLLDKALRQGDPLMLEIMERVTTYLSVLVASIVNFFDPEMIVFGGGVTEALGERLLEPIRRAAPQWYIQKKDADKIRIVAAELGDYAGVLGAATIARQNVGRG